MTRSKCDKDEYKDKDEDKEPERGNFKGPSDLCKRVAAFGWNESIGRLLVTEAGTGVVTMYDFADAPVQSEYSRLLQPRRAPPHSRTTLPPEMRKA
ncbi:hypothetical protein C8Q76DRAFT_793510 [Earliella scabrosa]|nr:hypothetical protein C8Q76DRAFT_793510 [Earliella scabrosa]